MTSQAFYGGFPWISLLKKHFHIKVSLKEGKQDNTKNVSIQFDTRKKKHKSGVPRLASSVYMPL